MDSRKKSKTINMTAEELRKLVHLSVRKKLIASMDGSLVTQLYNALAKFEDRKLLRSKGSNPQYPFQNTRTWYMAVFKKCCRPCVLKYEDTVIFESHDQAIRTLRQYTFRIIPENEPACKNMRNFVRNMIASRSKDLLEQVEDLLSRLVGKREVAGKTKKEKRECLNEWVYNALFGKEDPRERRRKEGLKQSSMNTVVSRNFKIVADGREFYLPFSVVILMLEFLNQDKNILDGPAMVNSQWHVLVLSCWKKIKLTFKNVYKIPLIVLNQTKSVVLVVPKTRLKTSSGKSALDYMFKNLQNLHRVRFENSGMEQTFRMLTQHKSGLTQKIISLDFSIKAKKSGEMFCLSSRHCKWIESSRMDNLKEMKFAIASYDDVLIDYPKFFHRLKKLQVFVNSGSISMYSVRWEFPNLSELNVSGAYLNPKCFPMLKKMSGLKTLRFVVRDDFRLDWKLLSKIEVLMIGVVSTKREESQGFFSGVSALKNLRSLEVILTGDVEPTYMIGYLRESPIPSIIKATITKLSSLPSSVKKFCLLESSNICGLLNNDNFRELIKEYQSIKYGIRGLKSPELKSYDHYHILNGWIGSNLFSLIDHRFFPPKE